MRAASCYLHRQHPSQDSYMRMFSHGKLLVNGRKKNSCILFVNNATNVPKKKFKYGNGAFRVAPTPVNAARLRSNALAEAMTPTCSKHELRVANDTYVPLCFPFASEIEKQHRHQHAGAGRAADANEEAHDRT